MRERARYDRARRSAVTESLTVTTERRQHHLWVRPTGELDHATAALLVDRIVAGMLPADTTVVIELAGLTFCDSAGLGALVRIHNRLAANSGHLTLAGSTPAMRRLLEITGLDTVFVLERSGHPNG